MKTKGEPSGSPFFRGKYENYSNMVRRAIKRNNNKKRKAELARVGKEATMTKAEKIQRGVKKFRSEMDSIQKESGGMFGNGNMTSNTLGVKKRKAKSVKNPFDNGFQSRRFF